MSDYRIWAYSSRHTGQDRVQIQAEFPRRLYLRSTSVDHPRLAPIRGRSALNTINIFLKLFKLKNYVKQQVLND